LKFTKSLNEGYLCLFEHSREPSKTINLGFDCAKPDIHLFFLIAQFKKSIFAL